MVDKHCTTNTLVVQCLFHHIGVSGKGNRIIPDGGQIKREKDIYHRGSRPISINHLPPSWPPSLVTKKKDAILSDIYIVDATFCCSIIMDASATHKLYRNIQFYPCMGCMHESLFPNKFLHLSLPPNAFIVSAGILV